jgi:hypothetical protein
MAWYGTFCLFTTTGIIQIPCIIQYSVAYAMLLMFMGTLQIRLKVFGEWSVGVSQILPHLSSLIFLDFIPV